MLNDTSPETGPVAGGRCRDTGGADELSGILSSTGRTALPFNLAGMGPVSARVSAGITAGSIAGVPIAVGAESNSETKHIPHNCLKTSRTSKALMRHIRKERDTLEILATDATKKYENLTTISYVKQNFHASSDVTSENAYAYAINE
jgi:hypothetical protein